MPYHLQVEVRPPYRLDLTVAALRRVPANPVDVLTSDGCYLRALATQRGVNVIEVRQRDKSALDICITGPRAQPRLRTVTTMLGVDVNLRGWYQRAKGIPWIDRLAKRFRGLKPPRYPELWEALCHGIVFQQLSILAGAAVMRRFVERFSNPIDHRGVRLYAFPRPEAILGASLRRVQSVGLSRMKAAYLRHAADSVSKGILTAAEIESLSTPEALRRLCGLYGIGPWSAAVILLRGFGRLDAFPLGDSGVARGLKTFSTGSPFEINEILSRLGGTRGMLYFYLLLARKATPESTAL